MKPGILLIGIGLALPAQADIFTLKDGTKLDATIKEKTLEEYTLEVNVTSSIKELRTIKRSEIVDHEIVSESETEFENVKDLAPAPPYLTAKEYKERIAKLNEFLAKHKVSTAGAKASRMLRELEAELTIVEAGGVKTETGLVKGDEVNKNALAIDAQGYAKEFENLVSERAYIPALRAYDKLESECFGTKAHRDTIPLFEKLVTSYGDAIARELDGFEEKEEKRLSSFERLPARDRDRAEAMEKERADAFEKLRSQEEEDGVTWPSVDVHSAESLGEMLDILEDEPKRLDDVKAELESLPETGELYRETYTAAAENDREKLDPLSEELEKAGIGQKYIDILLKLPGFADEEAEAEGDEDAAAEDEQDTEE